MINDDFKQILSPMTQRELYVVARRFGLDGREPATLQEVGDELHVSRERIRQIEAKALRKSRSAVTRNNFSLSDFIEL